MSKNYELEREWARQEWSMDIDDDMAATVSTLLAFQLWNLRRACRELGVAIKRALGL